MPRPKLIKIEKELLRELVGDDFDLADLDMIYSDPQVAKYLRRHIISICWL